MRTEYEVWRDELAGRRPRLVSRGQLLFFMLGLAFLVALGFTHR